MGRSRGAGSEASRGDLGALPGPRAVKATACWGRGVAAREWQLGEPWWGERVASSCGSPRARRFSDQRADPAPPPPRLLLRRLPSPVPPPSRPPRSRPSTPRPRRPARSVASRRLPPLPPPRRSNFSATSMVMTAEKHSRCCGRRAASEDREGCGSGWGSRARMAEGGACLPAALVACFRSQQGHRTRYKRRADRTAEGQPRGPASVLALRSAPCSPGCA